MSATPAPLTPVWRAVEALHDVVYFADDEIRTRFGAIGLKGFWMAYVASRSAALGPAGPAAVAAAFHGFAPRRIRRALPDAWLLAAPARVLETRAGLARDLLTPLIGADPALDRAGYALEQAVHDLDLGGRVLAAAHADVPCPADPVDRLWWAATVLREYRGDSHVAALVGAGLDGAEANVLASAVGLVDPERQRVSRDWTEAEWAAATDRLAARGWVDAAGCATPAGATARQVVEEHTDAVALAGLGDRARALLTDASLAADLTALARRVAAAGLVTYPNPTGVPAP